MHRRPAFVIKILQYRDPGMVLWWWRMVHTGLERLKSQQEGAGLGHGLEDLLPGFDRPKLGVRGAEKSQR